MISSPSRLDQVYLNGRCVYTNRSQYSIPLWVNSAWQLLQSPVCDAPGLDRQGGGGSANAGPGGHKTADVGVQIGGIRHIMAYCKSTCQSLLVLKHIFEQKTVDYTNPFMWTFPDQSLGVECYPLFPSFQLWKKQDVSWQKSSLICGFVAFTPCFLHMPTSVVCQKIGYPYILCLDIDARYPNFIPNDFLSTTGPQMSFFFPPRK